MGILNNIFGGGKAELIDFKERGAVVIDVRSPEEFRGGHVKGSKNIPLQSIANRADEIAGMKKPVILCCASGMRSGQASSILKKAGVECINGGGWTKVNGLY